MTVKEMQVCFIFTVSNRVDPSLACVLVADILGPLRDSPGNELQWTYPDSPVLCAQQGWYHLDIDCRWLTGDGSSRKSLRRGSVPPAARGERIGRTEEEERRD